MSLEDEISELANGLKLPTVARQAVNRFRKDDQEEALESLRGLLRMEVEERRVRRVERNRRESRLPDGKTFSSLDRKRFPRRLNSQLKELSQGGFIESATNVLAFGLPGVGKSHAMAALGHSLVDAGYRVFYTATFKLVQDLVVAKRELGLARAIRKLDLYDVLILDDIGYVQQSQDEMEVLFTLFSERYERRATVITSNLVFSQWGQIFKNPMTTAAAIDRIVHHSVILEFNVPSFRSEHARRHSAGASPEEVPPVPPSEEAGGHIQTDIAAEDQPPALSSMQAPW